ncbi:MAG TPA: class I SAM-dependent methyltransferase [Symbiobacteriaceae bacterium]|jgi:tRNA (adenine22-N1)-methyltransferase
MITLSPRLGAAAGYVLPGRPVADIGTDHGYLPAWLIETGTVDRAVAADVLPGPLEAARTTVAAAGLAARVELRLGSGLTVLAPGEAATVTICGMGGPLIAEILAAGVPAGVERLVLQPMGGEERLREWLAAHGWRLVAETLVEDAGRIYVVLAAEPGAMALSPGDALVGPFIAQSGGPLLERYIQILLGLARQALEGVRRSDRPEARQRAQELTQRMTLLEEVLAHGARDHR